MGDLLYVQGESSITTVFRIAPAAKVVDPEPSPQKEGVKHALASEDEHGRGTRRESRVRVASLETLKRELAEALPPHHLKSLAHEGELLSEDL